MPLSGVTVQFDHETKEPQRSQSEIFVGKLVRYGKALTRRAGIDVTLVRPRGKETLPRFIEKEFDTLFRKYSSSTMLPWENLHTAYRAIDYVCKNSIPGDVVECGVFKGGCSGLMANTLHNRNQESKQLYLFDTFTGMSEPTKFDQKDGGIRDATLSYSRYQKADFVDWCYGPLDVVKSTMKLSGYPDAKITFVKGKVEDTIPRTLPEKISLLRLDTDFYESTLHELVHLYPRLVPGGVLIVDDYSDWDGARKAVDEYFANATPFPLFCRDRGNGGVFCVKPPENILESDWTHG